MSGQVDFARLLQKLKPHVAAWVTRDINREHSQPVAGMRYFSYGDDPLTNTNFNGDSFSDVASWTKIDLSADFSMVPIASAVVLEVSARDSASASTDCYLAIAGGSSPTVSQFVGPHGLANDAWHRSRLIVPCDANGDLWYQIQASGSNTFDLWLRIFGYYR